MNRLFTILVLNVIYSWRHNDLNDKPHTTALSNEEFIIQSKSTFPLKNHKQILEAPQKFDPNPSLNLFATLQAIFTSKTQRRNKEAQRSTCLHSCTEQNINNK